MAPQRTAPLSPEALARQRRKVTAYHAHIQPILKATKETHHKLVPYHIRFQICNEAWRERLTQMMRWYKDSHKTTAEIQQITWDDIQLDYDGYIRDLRRRLDDYAHKVQEFIPHTPIEEDDGLTLQDNNYQAHMAQIIDRLNKEQPLTPFEKKHNLANELWEVRKWVRSEKFIKQAQDNERQRQASLGVQTRFKGGIRALEKQAQKESRGGDW